MVNVSKWGLLYAIWLRLEAGAVSRYEAMLAIYTIRLLFPHLERVTEYHDSRYFIPYTVHAFLTTIVDGRVLPGEETPQPLTMYSWLSVFQTDELLVIVGEAKSIEEQQLNENLEKSGK